MRVAEKALGKLWTILHSFDVQHYSDSVTINLASSLIDVSFNLLCAFYAGDRW